MEKKIYAIYDEKVNGIPGEIFTDYNDGTVIRGLVEQSKSKPISKDVAADLTLYCYGSFNFQTGELVPENRKVGRFIDFLSFSD